MLEEEDIFLEKKGKKSELGYRSRMAIMTCFSKINRHFRCRDCTQTKYQRK